MAKSQKPDKKLIEQYDHWDKRRRRPIWLEPPVLIEVLPDY